MRNTASCAGTLRLSLLAAAIGLACMSTANAAAVTLHGDTVDYAFDTTQWTTAFPSSLSFGQVGSSVTGNVLTLDFGQNWGVERSVGGDYSSSFGVAQNWFRLPMAYTAAAGYKIDGYRLTLAGAWRIERDPTADVPVGGWPNNSFAQAGLRTDGLMFENPTVANFTRVDNTSGVKSGSFLETALVGAVDNFQISGILMAVAVPGYTADPYTGLYAKGYSASFVRTLSVEVLTSPVPEPATVVLMLAGLAAVGVVARQRRSARG